MEGSRGYLADEARKFRDAVRQVDRANSVRDVAGLFQTSERTIWRLIKAGGLKAERLGPRCVRIFDSEIARYRATVGA